MFSRHNFLCGAAVLLTITIGAYHGTFQNGFVDFDDNIYVTENPHTAAGLSLAGFAYAWTTFDSGNWIPLTWLSYQFDVTLLGNHAWTFHLTSLIFHVLNVLLLFGWLIRVTGSRWRSFIVAAAWGVHPLHVESVAWIAERKDVLSAFWLLLILFAYEKYAARPATPWYLAMCTTFSLGLLSKSMLVTVPLLLLVVDIWPLERWSASNEFNAGLPRYPRRCMRWILLEKVPLLVLALVDGIVTIAAQDAGNAVGNQNAGSSLTILPLSIRLSNAVQGYVWYIAKTIWPTGLCVYYPLPLNNVEWGRTALSGLFLIGISVYVGVHGHRRLYLLLGWLWFLISLGPVIGLLQVGSQAYADRYCYIPHIGLLLFIVWESHQLLQRMKIPRGAALLTAGVAMCSLSLLTASQVTFWQSADTLWARALEVDPGNWFAHLQVGNRRVLAGHPDDEAFQHLKIVLEHRPDHAIALNNVGWIHQSKVEWNVAESYYRRSLMSDPRFESAMHNLVTVLKKQNRLADGLDLMKHYAERRPNDAKIQNELGIVYATGGQMELARARFTQAIRVAPDFANARYNLALALAQLGLVQDAEIQLRLLLKQYPNHPNAHINLGILLEKAGQLVEARNHYSAALENNPADQEARDRLQALNKRLPR